MTYFTTDENEIGLITDGELAECTDTHYTNRTDVR